MIRKGIILGLFSMFAMMATQATTMIGLRADDSKETFQISDVSSVKFQEGDVSTMDVNKTDGNTSNGFRMLVFSDAGNLSVSSVSSSAFFVYPNPVENIIYVDGTEGDVDIVVIDLEGKQLMQTKARQINVSSLQKGTYMLNVNGKTVKFIKK